jgi:hypothetical protein
MTAGRIGWEPSTPGLALEPIESEAASPGTVAAVPGKAKFQANTRDGSDRRTHSERREEIRFQDDRRKKDRRPRKSWEPGKNL